MNTECIHTTSQPPILWKHYHLGFRQCFNGDLFVHLLPLGGMLTHYWDGCVTGRARPSFDDTIQNPPPWGHIINDAPMFFNNLKYTLHYHQSTYSHKKAAHSYLYIAAIKYLHQLYNPTSKYSESDDYGQMS